MKVVKVIAAILISLCLLAAEGVVLGLFSVDSALSEESIEESMADSDVIGQLVAEALAENTVNMGGRYGEITQAVLHTDAMTGFFTAYLTSAVNAEVYGEPYEEVAYDELMLAFSDGVEEVNASGLYEVSEMEAELLKQAMQAEAPDLTAKLNAQVGSYEAVSGALTEEAAEPDEIIQTLMGTGTRIGAIAVCILLCGGLIALCWKGKWGFLWCGIVTTLAALAYGGLAIMGKEALLSVMGASASEEMVLSMVTGGLASAAVGGFIAAAVFYVAFALLRILDGRRRNEEDPALAERIIEGD